MNDTAAYALALVLTGGPVVMLAPFAIARRLVERHADQVANHHNTAHPSAGDETVKVIRARTGAHCVVIASKGVIFVDPSLDRATAALYIKASMPLADASAVAQWVGGIGR